MQPKKLRQLLKRAIKGDQSAMAEVDAAKLPPKAIRRAARIMIKKVQK